MCIRKIKGFTIVELLISISIMLFIIILMTSSLGQSLINFRLGNDINDASQARFFLTKELYFNMINLNNQISFENNSLDNRKFNFIYLSGKDNENRYKKLEMTRYTLEDLGRKTTLSYFFDNGVLYKEINGKKRELISNIEEFSFDYKERTLKCKGVLNAATETGRKKLPFDFSLWTGSLDIGVKYE